MFRCAPITAAVCASVLIAACGGTSDDRASDREAIDRTVRSFMTALAGSDTSAACDLLTPAAKAKAAVERDVTAGNNDEACRDEVARLSSSLSPRLRGLLRSVRVTNARISGDRAELTKDDVRVAERYADMVTPLDGRVLLVRTPDGWRIERM